METTIYVIGHKNPDTDSIISAVTYAYLKQAQGVPNVRAARAGKMNTQTEYIVERFGLPVPEFLSELNPKVKYFINGAPKVVSHRTPLWDALETIEASETKVLPIVDDNGKYLSLLHYNAFARNIMKKINPHMKAVIPTSVTHLLTTLKAQPVLTFNENEVKNSQIVVAASSYESFTEHLEEKVIENALVITGDREEIQAFCIEKRVRALILTGGKPISKELRRAAEENRVSVMISPFDTSSTALLIIYSTPVTSMGDNSAAPVNRNDPIRKVKPELARSASRALAVTDDDGSVVGVITEGDLIGEPNIEIIMVDHNETSQAIEGIENYRILEIIDHHRLGNLSTKYPITFINKPVGATSTIIAELYQEYRVPIPKQIASALLAGILADTLVLQSTTTTQTDRLTAQYLSDITNLDIQELGRDIMNAASLVSRKPVGELIGMDMKEYTAGDKAFAVSQVEVNVPTELLKRKDEIISHLQSLRLSRGHLFSALMVTDITELSSYLFIDADRGFISTITYPRLEDRVYVLKDILSRKKQLMPYLLELVEKYTD
jgi:manganese-dependent inorganic pyrophosphatase